MKKTILAIIIFVLVVVYAGGNAAYSYFDSKLSIKDMFNVDALFTIEHKPVFIASSDGDLEVKVMDADMLQTDADNIAVIEKGAINVSLDPAINSEKTTTCTFDFEYKTLTDNGYSTYIPTEGDNKEFTLEIIDSEGNSILPEISINEIDKINNENLSISTQKDTVSKTYSVIARVYNLDVEQKTLINKKYGFKIETKNINCVTK